ncbi:MULTISPECIES: hypothetical protein [unclassified Ruegeria]|uniref:hypothetical protein n=1 Tax=unclassified Ruegeria TaxID=2625375 RepID=UPI001ADB2B18|nr:MULTISPECIES: hypothetical protein [unclassified Ruegeria]MBO9412876.1 hypothetical protein [Ruegeria sp. R8_1]MBO9416577.1 hypothetical protein [Ruegeria sp. R8_2]
MTTRFGDSVAAFAAGLAFAAGFGLVTGAAVALEAGAVVLVAGFGATGAGNDEDACKA